MARRPKSVNDQICEDIEAELRRKRLRPILIRLAILGVGVGVAMGFLFVRNNHLRVAIVQQDAAVGEMNKELTRTQSALTDAVGHANEIAAVLVDRSKKQQQEMAALQTRYDMLKGLASGQEEIARAHRAILTERTMQERVLDGLSGFAIGVVSSWFASAVWSPGGRKR
jgi:uncharacterized membrane-anchored protein YhcB (DUF1043 family)